MIYKYKITRLDVVNTTNVNNYVVMAYYQIEGTDGTYTAAIQGACTYKVTEGDFIPFEELTEDQVIGWIKTSLGESGVESNQNYIIKEIEEQKNPTPVPHKEPLPWS